MTTTMTTNRGFLRSATTRRQMPLSNGRRKNSSAATIAFLLWTTSTILLLLGGETWGSNFFVTGSVMMKDDDNNQPEEETKEEKGFISSIDDGLLLVEENEDESFVVFEEQERQLSGEGIGPYVYSKIATIVPDPLLSYGDTEKKDLEAKYGRWHFWDGEEDIRPSQSDYCALFPNRDIVDEMFPDDAWQVDAVFVNHLLNDGQNLVSRAMEAMFTDFGRGKPLPPDGYATRAQMFRMEKVDLMTTTSPPEDYVPKWGSRSKGGWTTERSWDGFVRRLLHAMNTNDEFVVVLGGDSIAAGHGNHFRQAYLMHFHRIVSPILARMGVKLVTRNLAMGHGLGTLSSTLGFASLFNGQAGDIDLLIWDGELTEPQSEYADLFFRQGLLSGSTAKQGKIPFLLVGPNSNPAGLFDILRFFHNEADIDVGQLGLSKHSIPTTTSAEQAETLPEAFRYLICDSEINALCQEQKHCVNCWLDRPDIPNPKSLFPQMDTTTETSFAGPTGSDGEASRWWYPGWREHLLWGRNLAYFFLYAMQDGIAQWSSGTMGGPPLDEHKWHVTAMYNNMRTKLELALSSSSSSDDAKQRNQQCQDFVRDSLSLPSRICQVSMQGATQHTPRPTSPHSTSGTSSASSSMSSSSLVDLMEGDVRLVNPTKMQYEGPDVVHNQCFDVGNMVPQVVSLRHQRERQQRALTEGQSPRDEGAAEDDEEEHEPREEDENVVNDDNSWKIPSEDVSDFDSMKMMPPIFQHIHQARAQSSNSVADDNADSQLPLQPVPTVNSTRTTATTWRRGLSYEQGQGWSIQSEKPGLCNGEYLSICGRESSDSCPLLGHHDSQGELVGNDTSGWLVLNLPNLKHGIIVIQYSLYHNGGQGDGGRNLRTNPRQNHNHRQLLSSAATLPDPNHEFRFVFAIGDGPETSWTKQELVHRTQSQRRRMETVVLLDDAVSIEATTAKTVQVAIKVQGCGGEGNPCRFGLSHIYWA